ncbi:hypothetical protein PG989_000568 [Apiospora arundinis]
MRISTVFLALVAQSCALESLSQYVEDIPSCAHAALASAMRGEGCKTSDVNAETFDCMCRHMTPIVVSVSHAVSVDCTTEFASAIGYTCGTWKSGQILSSTASDLPRATSILGTELGAVPAATGTGAASAAATSKAAAAATVRPAARYFGAAVAAVVML